MGIEVEVAVVGGGFAGLCAAWELSRLGRRVVVLEADRVGADTTGHATTLQGYSVLGADAGRRYAASRQEALAHLAAIVAELRVDCALQRLPAYAYATTPAGADRLLAEADAAREAGVPVHLEPTVPGLPVAVTGAIRVDGQIRFDPAALVDALAQDLVKRGGQVLEHTRVRGVAEGESCRVDLDGGAPVAARDVVVATGYPILDWPSSLTPLRARREVVVTVPVAAAPDALYLAVDGDPRLVSSGRSLLVAGEADPEEWIRARYPVTGPVRRSVVVDHVSGDGVPYLGEYPGSDGHVWVAAGLGGDLAHAVVAGLLLAARIGGRSAPPWRDLYDPYRLYPVC